MLGEAVEADAVFAMPCEVPPLLFVDSRDGHLPGLGIERAILRERASLDRVRIGAVGYGLQEKTKIGVKLGHGGDQGDGQWRQNLH